MTDEKFKRVIVAEPFNVDVLYFSGFCSYKLSEYRACIEFCKKSSSLNPDKVENYFALSLCIIPAFTGINQGKEFHYIIV